MEIKEAVRERYGRIASSISGSASEEEFCCSAPATDAEEEASCCSAPATDAEEAASCCAATSTSSESQVAEEAASCCDTQVAEASSCCDTQTADAASCCDTQVSDTSLIYADMDLSDLPVEAIEASLGCANPVVFAELAEGEVVLDLGSGGGIDVLLASRYVGEAGKVYGLDMTDEMLRLANENKAKMGAANVEFVKGYIEDIPLDDDSIDVVLSNCVINLSDDKSAALAEAYRVIRPGGRLRVADIIATRPVDPEIANDVDKWCDCLAGAITVQEYERMLQDCGFQDVRIEVAFTYPAEPAFAGALISASK